MDEQERLRLLHMLNSVEKEEREEEHISLVNRDQLRRELFAGVGPSGNNTCFEEEAIERVGTDESDENVEESDHETGSEMSIEDENEQEEITQEPQNRTFIFGKDKTTKWDSHMITSNLLGRVRRHNIIRDTRIGVRLPSPKGPAKHTKTPYETWKLFFPDEFVDQVVTFTNIWIHKNRQNYVRARDVKDTDRTEMHAVFGLLFLAGMLRSSHTNLEDLWAVDGLGIEYFHCTMNIKRFKFLLRAMRFDDIRTRNQRKAQDKLAAIRDVLEQFVRYCQEYYSVSEFVTVDEMLEAFRGRCGFRQYIPNKPARYGIKMFALCDAKTYYTANLEIYAGKQPEGPYRVDNSSRAVTLRMIRPISGTGRHLTLDNWYGSIPLAQELLHNHRLTVVSTLKKNKPQVPPMFIENRGRLQYSSLFAYQDDTTLLSYVPRKNKVVLLVSTFHHTDDIDEESGEKCKPIILTCYNKFKGGVDTVDQMKSSYSVSRKSNRWTLTVFFSLMNISSINSYVILRSNIAEQCSDRKTFLRLLGKELCLPHMIRRASIPSIPRNLKTKIQGLCGLLRTASANDGNEDYLPTSGRCYLCGREKNRKSRTRCPQCKLFMCREHTTVSCVQCASEDQDDGSD